MLIAASWVIQFSHETKMNLLAVGEILLNRIKTDKNVAPRIVNCDTKRYEILIFE